MIYLFVGDTIEEPGPSQPRTRYTARSLAHRSPPTVFTTSNTLGPRFRSHPDIDGAFQVKRESRQHLVTFSPGLANQRPDTLRLLTFGDTLFDGATERRQATSRHQRWADPSGSPIGKSNPSGLV